MRSVLKMGRKLLIVASKRYGDYVKEIAESMGCFEEISFVDNDREGAIGKLEDVESFYPEYNCAIAACDDGTERLEWNKKLETLYNIPVLAHMDSTISPSANLMPGCIVEPRAVIGCGSTIGQATIIGANVVVEPYCFIGDSCTLKSGTIVKSTSMVAMNTSTEQGSVLFTSLTKD
jgi:UDP-3-O-[3-hydroxymyristoyl] glucosamine N-acyltransferase